MLSRKHSEMGLYKPVSDPLCLWMFHIERTEHPVQSQCKKKSSSPEHNSGPDDHEAPVLQTAGPPRSSNDRIQGLLLGKVIT